MNKKFLNIFVICIFIIIAFVVSIKYGASEITFRKLFQIISGVKDSDSIIVWQLRVPRTIMAFLSGAALALCGTVLQSILRNGIADPFITGSSSGAALGAAIAIAFLGWIGEFAGITVIPLFAFIFSIIMTIFSYNLALKNKKINSETLILAGISINFLVSSIIAFIFIFKRESMEKIIFWTMGSFAFSTWNQIVFLSIIFLLVIIIFIKFKKEIDILVSGDECASTIGVNIQLVKKILLFSVSVLVASTVTFCGIIGFVGMVVPHISNHFNGKRFSENIISSVLIGGLFLLLCDCISRTLFSPIEIPVGAVTSLVGAPYFIYLLKRRK